MFKTILLASLFALVSTFASADVLEMSCNKSQVRAGTDQTYTVSADTKRKLMIVKIDNTMVPMAITAVNATAAWITVSAVTKYGNAVDATFVNPDNDSVEDKGEQALVSFNFKDNMRTIDRCQ